MNKDNCKIFKNMVMKNLVLILLMKIKEVILTKKRILIKKQIKKVKLILVNMSIQQIRIIKTVIILAVNLVISNFNNKCHHYRKINYKRKKITFKMKKKKKIIISFPIYLKN